MPSGVYQRTDKNLKNLRRNHTRGSHHPLWKGGKTIQEGYVCILSYDHPKAKSMHNGYVYEHILIMEKKIGRFLIDGEVVHHRDGNKINNELSNLELLSSPREHARIHIILRKCKSMVVIK